MTGTKRSGTKRGGYEKHAKSSTRSETMKGRVGNNQKGGKAPPRQSVLQGLTPRPKPDPNLKPWPNDSVVIVAATPLTVNVAGIREFIVDQKCSDCQCRLAVDNFSIRAAWEMPERRARPLRFLCVGCCQLYDRSSIEKLIDNRTTKGGNEGQQLDE